MFIYKFTNPYNGDRYIGMCTKTIDELYKRYLYEISTFSNRKIKNVLKKHGINNFRFEIIKDGIDSIDVLKQLERYFIELYQTYRKEYNMTIGGDAGCGNAKKGRTRRQHTNEEKERIRVSNIGKHNIVGEKNPMFGKHHSLEAKQKISSAQINRKRSQQQIETMSKMFKGVGNPRYIHLSNEVEKRITQLYDSGISVSQISRELQLSRTKIRNEINRSSYTIMREE